MSKIKILYLSYDGMTDPLGQSQVLPYIIGLASKGYEFTLISFEKEERYVKYKNDISVLCKENNIKWEPLSFTTFPPLLSKIWDNFRMKKLAETLHLKENFQMIHCRSYISAGVGMYMKKKHKVKFFFDMRGFWVDERIEGGIWNKKNPLYNALYHHYKKKEADYISNADYIISLTEAGKKEILSWKSYTGAPIKVIPCSADFTLFQYIDNTEKEKGKAVLGLAKENLVITYLGSIGTWYLLDEMLLFFKKITLKNPTAKFLFLTQDPPDKIVTIAEKYKIPKTSLIIKYAKRAELRTALSATDIGIMFIKESYSKIASSPTKLGELLAMGIPVICNSNVGDVKDIINKTDGGISLDVLNEQVFETVVSDQLTPLLNKERKSIRESASSYYNLELAIEQYYNSYKQLL